MYLARDVGLTEARCCLFERTEENLKHEPRQAILIEKPLETALVGPKVAWGRASGNHQCGANSGSQADGVSVLAPASGSVGG